MEEKQVSCCAQDMALITLDTAVVGSGCAGFNAADWLWDLGVRDIGIFTDGVMRGTSRNTGSDKQTYYKLSLAAGEADSVAQMAADLFAGGGMDGDVALAQAAGSVRSFMKLVNLGVPFPADAYGAYVGYKTDHDPRQRATSAGPLTSRYMTEALEASVRRKGIRIWDGMQAVRLFAGGGKLRGMLCLDTARAKFVLVRCKHLILATGGPAGVYADSVYPESQAGGSGLAIEAGAACANVQEWQYGLASLSFRWNVSGTYQQVLPRYISVDGAGREREFLAEALSPAKALELTFLKGYQWPFDAGKVAGSSLVDLLVYRERQAGRRVFLDYRANPRGLEGGFEATPAEARDYLERSGALFGTPYQRLERMNPGAIALYKSHGIDLARESLEIGVCAQHHNGGIAVDCHWETDIAGLFVVGEAAGTFGVRRPGGTALNAGQVGALRAAECIAEREAEAFLEEEAFLRLADEKARPVVEGCAACLEAGRKAGSNVRDFREKYQREMSRYAAQFRYPEEIARLRRELEGQRAGFFRQAAISGPEEFGYLLRNYDILVTQLAILSAMETSCAAAGSRGSALVLDGEGVPVWEGLPGLRCRPEAPERAGHILETRLTADGFRSAFRPARPLPHPDDWFENVWRDYRARMGKRPSSGPAAGQDAESI